MNHIEAINRPETVPEYTEPGWVDTPTSTRIRMALMYAQTTPTIAVVYGGGYR